MNQIMESKTARDIMRPTTVALRRKMSLDRVSDHLTKHGIPGAPVVNIEGELIGYVSEYDCLKALMQSSYYHENSDLVEDVMSTTPIMTTPDITTIDLAEQFNENKVNVMPVVENGKLVGAVSRGDIMRALIKDLETVQTPV